MRHRGFTLWIAILLIGFVSVVIAATMSLVRTDIARTSAAASDAQLRQLLLAGQSLAMEDLNRDGAVKDREFATDFGRLTVKSTGPTKAAVFADIAGKRAEQTLDYVRSGDAWRLGNAALP